MIYTDTRDSSVKVDFKTAVMGGMNAKTGGSCGGCCQVFIAYDPYIFGEEEEIQATIERRIDAVHASHPVESGGKVTFPGERTVMTRKKSME